ncbi:MAG TPA: hypothetical protein VKN36_04615 [Eudoraea sp.]|nr:hypothetical protein [Eudoraea sp.]
MKEQSSTSRDIHGTMLIKRMQSLPLGYSEVRYQGKKYGVTRSVYNFGRSMKVYAEELGGRDTISLNFYTTTASVILKPCEMTEQKVVHFLMNFQNPSHFVR